MKLGDKVLVDMEHYYFFKKGVAYDFWCLGCKVDKVAVCAKSKEGSLAFYADPEHVHPEKVEVKEESSINHVYKTGPENGIEDWLETDEPSLTIKDWF